MELATLYIILVCNYPTAMIVERQIDDRAVTVPWVFAHPNPDLGGWVEAGIKESMESNEVFKIETVHECQLT